MSAQATRRGFDPNDAAWFSAEAITGLGIAQEEIQWLLDRGYQPGPVVEFVGSHHQLHARQRIALQRSTSSQNQYQLRQSKKLPFEMAKDGCLYIDGFNLIITLEVALSQSLVVLGKDDVLRDLAGLRGTYRLIGQTEQALELIGKAFRALSVPQAVFYLDQPVSNSGRLRQRILAHAEQWPMPVQVELVPNSDVVLARMARIVTGDSVILDQCASWFNLSRKIVDDYVQDAWIVRFNEETHR